MVKTNISLKSMFGNARAQLIGRYGTCILASLSVIMVQIFATLASGFGNEDVTISQYLIGFVISVIIDLLMGILSFGQCFFYLKVARGREDLFVSDIFSGFKSVIDKAICVQIVFTIFSIIGALPSLYINLFHVTIPAEHQLSVVIAIYAFQILIGIVPRFWFGLSFYLLADNPDLEVREIIGKSVKLMRNQKGRLLLIYLSLIPLFVLSFAACFVGVLWFVAFEETLMANFYLDTIGEEGWKPFTVHFDSSI